MPVKPEVSVVASEPQGDKHGQFWSPAKITLAWPQSGELPAPSIEISVVAPIRGQMTVDELRGAHLQAAHDVISAALLSIEAPAAARRTESQKVRR